MQLEYPEGLQSEVSTDLVLSGAGTNLEISGDVEILNAIYAQDIDLTEQVFSSVTNAGGLNGAAGLNGGSGDAGWIDAIGLDVAVRTPGLVTVTNNLANLDLTGTFQVRGSVSNPVIIGRAEALPGGELYFGGRVGSAAGASLPTERRDRYIIEQGTIDFNNPVRTEPDFTFVATHELNLPGERYLITLRANGTPQTLRTELSSDPPESEYDIMLMLLTGRTSRDIQGAHLDIAREQLANYLSGELGGFFDAAGSVLGLDTVRIEPVTLATATEEDLSARLTVGKDITKEFSFLYSQNLAGARAQTWIANYQTYRNFLIRGINESDNNTIRAEVQHDLRIGGGPPLPARVQPRNEAILGKITFEGTTLPEEDLLDEVTEPGEPFNAYRLNQDTRRLQQFYAARDFLGVKIRAERNRTNGDIDVRFVVDEGPRITFEYGGARVPRRIQDEIRQIWVSGFAEGPSLNDSRDRLLRFFRDEGYLRAAVSTRDISSSQRERRFAFDIDTGPEFDDPIWIFHGIEPMDIDQTAGEVLQNPTAVKGQIEFELQRQGYLDAVATQPELVVAENRPRFEVTVERGPLYDVGRVNFSGNQFFEAETLLKVLESPESEEQLSTLTSSWLDTTRQRIVSHYWANGFNDVQVVPVTAKDPDASRVDVEFQISEGPQEVVSEIRISGNAITDLSHVRRQFTFRQGDPVDLSRINLTRKKLYDTRLFKRVDLNIVDGPNGQVADLQLNEQAPWRLRYGFTVGNRLQTSDRNLGFASDLSYGNLWGKGIIAGTSIKATPSERDGRVFGSLPVFLGRDATTIATLFRTRDLTDPDFISDDTGFTIQQQWRLKDFYIVSYDYTYKRNRTFERDLVADDPFGFDVTIAISGFNGTVSRDTRDDILNATRGTFLSNSLQFSPPGIGSFLTFLRNYTQYFRFQPVREKYVWATGIRAGIARGFRGQDMVPSEQFLAGGSTTLRGFKQDQLTADAGNALFVVNQEFRFPLFWRFGGVGFFDAGNVFTRAADFNPFKLRYSPGVGLRVNTPFVLLRFDLGFNLFPRDGEPNRRFAFGIGQAF
jgi:outer membrane protein assembly complex protein YaeT